MFNLNLVIKYFSLEKLNHRYVLNQHIPIQIILNDTFISFQDFKRDSAFLILPRYGFTGLEESKNLLLYDSFTIPRMWYFSDRPVGKSLIALALGIEAVRQGQGLFCKCFESD
jgi:hypothetical protein